MEKHIRVIGLLNGLISSPLLFQPFLATRKLGIDDLKFTLECIPARVKAPDVLYQLFHNDTL